MNEFLILQVDAAVTVVDRLLDSLSPESGQQKQGNTGPANPAAPDPGPPQVAEAGNQLNSGVLNDTKSPKGMSKEAPLDEPKPRRRPGRKCADEARKRMAEAKDGEEDFGILSPICTNKDGVQRRKRKAQSRSVRNGKKAKETTEAPPAAEQVCHYDLLWTCSGSRGLAN